VPRESDAAAALALNLKLVRSGQVFVRLSRSKAVGGVGEASLHLLPKEEVIQVHCESLLGEGTDDQYDDAT